MYRPTEKKSHHFAELFGSVWHLDGSCQNRPIINVGAKCDNTLHCSVLQLLRYIITRPAASTQFADYTGTGYSCRWRTGSVITEKLRNVLYLLPARRSLWVRRSKWSALLPVKTKNLLDTFPRYIGLPLHFGGRKVKGQGQSQGRGNTEVVFARISFSAANSPIYSEQKPNCSVYWGRGRVCLLCLALNIFLFRNVLTLKATKTCQTRTLCKTRARLCGLWQNTTERLCDTADICMHSLRHWSWYAGRSHSYHRRI